MTAKPTSRETLTKLRTRVSRLEANADATARSRHSMAARLSHLEKGQGQLHDILRYIRDVLHKSTPPTQDKEPHT